MRLPGAQMAWTVSLLRVRVPVLSVAIVVTTPIVSIAAIVRTSALRRAMRCIPMAKMTEIATGSPSGTALTASAITNCSAAVSSMPRHSANPSVTTDATNTTTMI